MSSLGDAEPLEVPDYAEAIEAWRVWRVVPDGEGYSLGSVIKPTLWPAGEPLRAECLRRSPFAAWLRRRRGEPHHVPEGGCECGIYAAWLPEIGQYLTETPAGVAVARVLGRVSLWGKVVECERGFRAANAYPLQIFVPADATLHPKHRPEDVLAGLEPYGVPVELLSVRCADAVLVLEQAQLASAQRRDG